MDPHQAALVATATRLGIATEDLSGVLRHDVVRYEHAGRSHLVREGKIFESLSSLSEFLCQEKHVCKAVLADVGVPTPDGIQFANADAERDAIEALLASAAPLVIKPSASEGGEGVFVDLRSFEDVRRRWWPQRHTHTHFVLEEQVEGMDLRIHVIAGRIVAACVREAAYVVGDGAATIEALVEVRQGIMRTQNPENRLELDEVSDRLLTEQGLSRDAIPAAEQKVVLKDINNLALGGVAVDVTDEIHTTYASWARDVAKRFELSNFALDVLAADPGADPVDAARVIEINAKPDWLHHTFSERRHHDMPRLLLEHALETRFLTP